MVDDGKPTKAIKQMAALESSSDLMPNAEESNTRLKISIKSVKAAGSAFLKTVSIKRPLMRSLLGSSAREETWNPNRKTTDQRHLRRHDGIGKG